MITESLSTLKIHKLTQEQYDREVDAGNIDQNALYLTPDEEVDLSSYATVEQLNEKASISHSHDDTYYTESEVDTKLASKADKNHSHNSDYDTKGSASAVQENLDVVSDSLNAHADNSNIHVTATDKTNWNAAYTHSTSTHARVDATNVADSATNGNIKINGTETNVYSHPNSGVTAGTYKSVTVNAQGHITSGSNPTTLSGYGITDAETKGAASNALASAKEYTDSVASGKSDKNHNHDAAYDAKGSAADSLASAKSYTDTKTSDLASNTVVDNKIGTHNTSASAHDDIRDLISELTTRLNTLANSDDVTLDQMSEIVAYIKNNKGLIDGVTTSKVNVSDIVNNLTTNVTNKPLSAAQGVAIKSLIDSLQEELDSHTHEIADIDGLTTTLANKAEKNHGTHVVYLVANPLMDGTASAGSKNEVARADHRHPTDTSRASKTEFDAHDSNTTKHITSTERTNWNAAKTHSDSVHAPSNAEKNQNAFSNVKIGDITIAADTATDTLELVGSNVTITPDATNDKITIEVASGSTSAAGIVKLTNSTSSTSTTTAATPNSVKSAYDLANTAKTNAATAQNKADSAYTLAESKIDSLSDLGVTATVVELNYMDGVTSSVQTQLDGKSASSHTHTNASLGQGNGYCSTPSSTAAKVVSLLNYKLVEGGIVSVEFIYSVPSSATMNINNTGAKEIYYRGEAITENIIKGADRATFIYYSSRYHLISVDRWHEDIVDLQATDGKVYQVSTTANSNYPLLLARNFQNETTTDNVFFDSGVYLNPSTNTIAANISGTANGLKNLAATIAELNYMEGVTSNVQTQLSSKADKIAGIVHQYAGVSAPDGYLLCDGYFYRTDEYPELFDAIGFTYGEAGSGVNLMFAVPNMIGRVAVGAYTGVSEDEDFLLGTRGGERTHALTVNEMPKHDHGAVYTGNADTANKKYDWYTATGTKIGYQVMESGSGTPHNNMQPYMALHYIISTGK